MIMNFLKWFDIYGHQVSVNYKGDGMFKTNFGGLLSLATIVLIIVNTVSLTTQFVDRTAQKENQRTLNKELLDQEPMHLSDNQFDVLMSVQNKNGTLIELPSNIGQWSVIKYSLITYAYEPLTVGLCNERIYDE